MILSIVTVVKDDLDGLMLTSSSIDKFVEGSNFEHIIWWNDNHELEASMLCDVSNRSIYKGADSGIFDAMNSALVT